MPWTNMPMRWYLSTQFFKSDYFGQEVARPPLIVARPPKSIFLPLIVLGAS